MPDFTFTSPEGSQYTISGPEGATKEQAFGILQQHIASQKSQGLAPPPKIETPPVPAAPIKQATMADLTPKVGGESVGETLLHMATGVPAAFVGKAAELGARAGIPHGPATPEQIGNRVTSAMTYTPRSEQGQNLTNRAESGFNTENQFENEQVAAHPALAPVKSTVDAALALGGPLAGPLAAEGSAASAARAAAAPKTALTELQQAGYQMRPSDVPARNPTVKPGDVPGSTRESITSNPQQTESIVRNNAANSTRLIGEEIGVPDATKLTPKHYAEARKAPGADYDRVGEAVGTVEKPLTGVSDVLGNAADDQSVQAMPAAARAQARRVSAGLQGGKYTGSQIIKDISYFKNDVGGVSGRAVADALENELGEQVKAKAPNLSGTYENARTLFAKIQNAEDATTGGIVDAADYRRLGENNPRLLTGNSRLVHMAGGELPAVTRLPKPTADQSLLGHTAFETGKNLIGKGLSKLPLMDITRPATQARIAGAAPAPGPLPVGPPQRGLPDVRQLEISSPGEGRTLNPATPQEGPPLGRSFRGGTTDQQIDLDTPGSGRPTNLNLESPPGAVPPRTRVLGPLGQGTETPEAFQTSIEGGGSPSPFELSPGEVGTPPLGAVLARNAGRLELPSRTTRSKLQTPPNADIHPEPGTTASPGQFPPEAPGRVTGPPEGQLPKRLGDLIRHLMERGSAPRGRHGE